MILDTNALSAFADGVTPVVQQIATADELHIPVIVLGEYRFGIATSRRRRQYEAWLARGRALWNVLSLVEDTATHYALIRQQLKRAGAPLPASTRRPMPSMVFAACWCHLSAQSSPTGLPGQVA